MTPFDFLIIGLYLMYAHWVADFVFQSHAMATQKSVSNYWLSMHVGTYLFIMTIFVVTAFPLIAAINWLVLNAVLHWITDYITSRESKKYFSVQDFHNGFVIVGFDQYIHFGCIMTTAYWFFMR